MAKIHSSLATTELHNPKGIGVESFTEELLTMSASLGAVSASASMVPHTTDVFSLGSATQRWNDIIAKGNISSSVTSTGSFGRLEIAKNATIDGTLTLAGGTTTIGDAASDTLVITADLASNLIPDADGTRDLGSAAASWRNLWADGTGSFKNTITTNRAYFYDAGGEYISGDGTDLNLVSSADINIPANIGLTFGDDGEKIEGNGTNLTLAGGDINLTAEADVNIPANIGVTFGDDGEKIEGNGTKLTIASSDAIDLTATTDVVIPSGVGLTFAGSEKLESDGTDLSITVGAGGDINIPADIGLTFGDDGEKIEGDGTDLTIASSNELNLSATTDVVIPVDVGLHFGDGNEKIESNNTALTINSGEDINLTATTDINVPSGVGLTFGNDGEKIEGNGTKLDIAAAEVDFSIEGSGDINIGANIGLTFGNDGEKIEGDGTNMTISANKILLDSNDITGSATTTGSFGSVYSSGNVGVGVVNPAVALEVVGAISASTSGSFEHLFVQDRIVLGNKQDSGEYIVSDGTDISINVGANGDINVPANIGMTFGNDAEKIEGDGTDLTITGNIINLSPTADVAIPVNKGLLLAGTEKLESDGTDLSITVGAGGDINIGSDIGLTFGDDGEKIEGDGTDLTIASSNELNLSATTDVVIPVDVGLHFGDGAEKIESNNTALTINSGEDINLTATTDINVPSGVGLTFGNDGEKIEGNGTKLDIAAAEIDFTIEGSGDINIPADIGLTFGDDGEKIEGDGTDLTIASSGVLTLSSGGNTVIETVTLNNGNVTIPGDLTVTGDRLEAQVGSLQVADHTITVGSGSATSALMEAGGLDWGISGSIANLRYQHATTSLTSSVFLAAPKLTVDTITLDAAEIDASGALDIDTGGDLTLSATGDVNIPSGIGLTFGNDGEKIEGNGTKLDIAAAEIDLSVEASGDINIPADIGLTFGNDAEKIEGDGTDLTITGNKINLSPTEDVVIPVNKGITFGTHEKIESDDTDLNISVGSSGDINIPADIGLTFGDDGEKIEGDGTDLTITGAKINLTPGTDVHIPVNKGIAFGTHEKIESDDTDLTLTVGSGGDINIGTDIGLTFGNDGEKIEGNGTKLVISAAELDLTMEASGDINIPADIGFTFGDDAEKIEGDGTDLTISANSVKFNTSLITGSGTITGSFGQVMMKEVGSNWTNAGNTVADGGTFTTIDINGGTVDGTDVTVGSGKTLNVSAGTLTTSAAQKAAIVEGVAAYVDIGAYDFRANTLIADDLTSGRVVFTTTNGQLTDDSDLTFATDTLTATKLGAFEAAGAIDFSDENMTNVDINSGAIDGTAIGAASHTTIKGTTIDATTDFTIDGLVITADTITNDATLTIDGADDMVIDVDGGNFDVKDAGVGLLNVSATLVSGSATATGSFGSIYTLGIITGSSVHASGDIVAFSSSDRELKDNLTVIKGSLDKIAGIHGYEFDWNKKSEYEGHDIGVVAQEVEAVIPEVVRTNASGYKAIRYEKMVPVLIEAIKELHEKVEYIEKNCECLNK